MSFQDILKELVDSVAGGTAATVMGMDGIAVTQYTVPGDYDVETVGIEYGKVIEEIKNASTILNLGTLEEVMVATAGMDILLRMVTQDYYIAFIVGKDAISGKARYLLKKAAARAAKELK